MSDQPFYDDALTNPTVHGKPPGPKIEPDLIGPGLLAGQGNNGSANQAHMAGHAGTAADFLSIPRQLGFGQTGAKPT